MRATYVYAGVAHWLDGSESGLFRLEVSAARWTKLAGGLPATAQIMAVTVCPHDPDTIYAGSEDGPYVSRDRGERWERLAFPERGVQVWSIAVHPKDPRLLYAGVSPSAVWRSADGGQRWERLARSDLPARLTAPFACRVMRFAIDPAQPDHVYAVREISGTMRSRDAGETWEDCSAGLVALAAEPRLKSRIVCQDDSEGMLDGHALCVSAAAPGTVVAALRMGLFRSADGGEHWEDMKVGRFSPLTYARDVRVSPHDPNTLYACLSVHSRGETGSICRSQDGGKSWARFDHGTHAEATMMALATHPADPAQVYCIARFGQTFGTQDGGKSWREYRLPAGCRDVYALACA